MAAAVSDYEPSLRNIVDQTSLNWVFVGGKGGVGKTTISLAIQLSRVRESVLIISTDPAHSLNDAFGQTFSMKPQLVEGFTNLSAMEIHLPDEEEFDFKLPENPSAEDQLQKMIRDAVPRPEGFPGVDEMIGMSLLWSLIRSMKYSVVVFDTAPTGHTLRFMGVPFLFHNMVERFAPFLQAIRLAMRTVVRLTGQRLDPGGETHEELFRDLTSHLRNPAKTTFVGVCTAEFLPLYETERLIQRLTVYGIDTHNLVVNQLHFSDTDDHHQSCARCRSRRTMQEKYMAQITSLYQDVHVTKLPLLENEVRGVDLLEPFSDLLLHPYTPGSPATIRRTRQLLGHGTLF